MSSPADSSVANSFQQFRAQLDDHYERRERLIKASRDITSLSKKAIFLIHRLVVESSGHSLEEQERLERLAGRKGRERLAEVQKIYASLQSDLEGDQFWRYERQVSPGLQEYIEALSFAHFLEHRSLVTYDEVRQSLSGPDGAPYIPLGISEYLLGVSDLTGELMRFAISAISRRGGRTKAGIVCAFVRSCKADLGRFTPYVSDLASKQAVTARSLTKIEDAAYALVVRGSEYDIPPDMLEDIVSSAMEGYSHHGINRRTALYDDNDNDQRS